MFAMLANAFAPSATHASEIGWEGGITAVYQDTDDSRADFELTASADLFATLKQQKGEWLLYIEASSSPKSNGVSAFYPTVNGDAGSVLTAGGDGGVQISELNYTFFMGGNRSVMLGLIDPSAWLDRGRIANDENIHFLNGSFVNNSTIAFPDYTLGGVFRFPAENRRPEFTLVITGSDGIADTPDRSYQDLLDLNDDGRGIFLGAGAAWLNERTSWRVGAWLRNDNQGVEGELVDDENNYGVYGVFGWQDGANAINVRAGMANSNVSAADRFLAIAYQRKTNIGLFGIGVADTRIPGTFSGSGNDDALDSEIYFRIPILDNAGHITPSIQYVKSPAVDSADRLSGSSAIVAGVRFHWSF
ncbi:MAG: carbohydrate porin [Gammaproteobacteria bacterium]|nr:carbohydrate porin [Gammaproteobacteria bacterium]